MKYQLHDLIDMDHFQVLQDRLNEIYSFPSAIIDIEGNILTATAWQDICTQFHRKNKDCEKFCIQSDQYILSHLHEANPAVSYRCPHGLVDNATPIIIGGIHYGNFFTGQFFLESPDMDFFMEQAKKYGFDEEAYLAAVKKVPIWSKEQLNSYLFFIKGLITIISESGLKKLAEIETRKQSEEIAERANTILHQMHDGFWVTTPHDGRIIDVNDAMCRMLGYTRDELMKLSVADLDANDSPEVTVHGIQFIIEKGSVHFESRFRCKNGDILDVDVRVTYLPERKLFFSFYRDITESKQAELALRESEERFRAAFMTSPDSITINRLSDSVYLDINEGFTEIMGYTREDCIGKTPLDISVWCDLKDRERYLTGLRENGSVRNLETKLRTKDGSIRFVLISARTLSLNGESCILSMTRDITVRKRVEEELRKNEARKFEQESLAKEGEERRLLLDNIQTQVWYLIDDHTYGAVNAAHAAFFGRRKEDLAFGSLSNNISGSRLEQHKKSIREVFATGKAVKVELWVTNASGEQRLLSILRSPVLHADGTVKYVVCSAEDVTERKRYETALRESEGRVRAKLDAMLSPEGNIDTLELSDIIDVPAIQQLMDEFVRLNCIGIGLYDLQNKVQIATGWQDICMKFHRVNPETALNCMESDTALTQGVEPGTCKMYRCKNNMWDIVTPITLDGKHLGNLFIGQFFVDDEVLDSDFFRDQARRYGFDEKEYLDAYEKVPHWSRKKVEIVMRLCMRLADLIARLSFNNIKLVRTLMERNQLAESLRKSEENHRILFESAGDVIFILNTEARMLAVNPLACERLGYTYEELMSMTIAQVLSPEERWAVPERATRIMEQGHLSFESVHQRKDGSKILNEVNARRILYDGQPAIMSICHDITERKQMEEELREINRKLEAAVNHAEKMAVQAQTATITKSRFLANMSHEIRTPLNAILGFSQLMQHDPELSSRQKHRVMTINRSGEHLLALLNDILELSKIEAGRLTVNSTTFNLHALLEDLEMVFRNRAEAKQLTLDFAGIDRAPCYIFADEQKLRQVLTNLLGNAVKFTITGGVRLHVWAEPAKGKGPEEARLVILVEDSGPGIEPEAMDRLFDPFEQTSSGRRDGQGTGLGLAISRQFARIMGGDVSVASEPDKGSVFRLEIPVTVQTEAKTQAKIDDRHVLRLDNGQPRCRVLIVDDTEDSRGLLVQMLGGAGFEVFEADGGDQALTKFTVERPHLILMDHRMPGMDGDETIRRIRSLPGGDRVKIITLTASATDENRNHYLEAKADEFMAKPFRESELFEKIRLMTGVRYIYAETDRHEGPTAERKPVLTKEILSFLPNELGKQIHEAAISGRHDKLLELFQQVAVSDPITGGMLRDLGMRFDYETIIHLFS